MIRLFLILVVGYLLVGALIAFRQRRFIYFPPRFTPAQAEQEARNAGLEPWVDQSGRRIGWKRLTPVRPAQGRILMFHGNASCAFWCDPYADAIQPLAAWDFYSLEYPGYADRPGAPSEQSLCIAAEDAFAALPKDVPIYLMGESLGTGVATWLGGKHPDQVAGLILLAPFNSLVAVAQSKMPILPVRWILQDPFQSAEHLQSFHGPVAVVVVDDDQVVPARFGRALYAGYDGPKQLWEVVSGGHNAVSALTSKTWGQLVDFVQKPDTGLAPGDVPGR